ncbi:hypothetical protein PR002_g33189 [Phytophthora rubi]|uniref:Uncharacterized protein n=1 Tax=Phytophthora rubi TaxID=129364 RepID=A0A6A3G1T1_9STRA|nr:hypothetical protein PR002_g33189 [Phytophthora rubi]
MVSARSSSSLRLSRSCFFSSWCASSSSRSSATFASKSSSSAWDSANPLPRSLARMRAANSSRMSAQRSLQRRRHSAARVRLGPTLSAVRVVREHLRQQRRVRLVREADGVLALLGGGGGGSVRGGGCLHEVGK